MPELSPVRKGWPLLPGLKLLGRGKVRDMYELPDGNLLVVATDGVSIYDFVLNAIVPMKGVILTALTVFWADILEHQYGIRTHLIASGAEIDQYLPEDLRNLPDLQSRALVVKRLDIAPVEFIVRGVLTGSSVGPYNETGMVCGHRLPAHLQDGDELPFPLDTPSSKAVEGHDQHLSADQVRVEYPEQTYSALKVFQIMHAYAKLCGIFMADTKFEFGKDGTLADEFGTPDSSRFWLLDEWEKSRMPTAGRKAPTALDKQLVREAGKLAGINMLDPEKPEDVAKAHTWVLSRELIKQTTQTYRYIFWRLTGQTIEDFLREVMHVRPPEKLPKKVIIICGSESDLPAIIPICKRFLGPIKAYLNITIHVISCHRNPHELLEFIQQGNINGYDVIICAGGMALALPGVIDAWLHFCKKTIPVAGVALGEPDSQALLAAQLSITQLPGQPVIFNETTGQAYTGSDGLFELLERIRIGELPPAKSRREREVRFSAWSNYQAT